MLTKVTDRSLREAAETPPGLAHQLLAPAPAMVQQVVGETARGDATTTAVIHQPQQHVPQAAYLQHGGVQQHVVGETARGDATTTAFTH